MLNARRKIRIAKGAGTTVQEVNRLIKMHQEMATMMKKIKKMGGLQKLGAMFGKGGGAGAMAGLLPPGMAGGAAGPGGLPMGGKKFGTMADHSPFMLSLSKHRLASGRSGPGATQIADASTSA